MKKYDRLSNFELLRIIAMFMIVCFHYAYKGGWSFAPFAINRYIIKAFLILGEWGVNLFMLVTGYFLIGEKHYDQKIEKTVYEGVSMYKLCSLVAQSIFYTAIINMFGHFVLGYKDLFSLKILFKTVMPELFDTYWYVTVYLLIYIMHPYINCMLHAMTRKMMERFLITSLIIWCVIPTIFRPVFGTSERGFYYNRLIWLIIIYCIGAYIRIWGLKCLEDVRLSIWVCIATFLIMNIINIVMDYLPMFVNTEIKEFEFWPPNTVLMLILSVTFFNIFRLLKIKYNPVINIIARTTLGVYMLHDGSLARNLWNFMRNFLATGYVAFDIAVGAIFVYVIAVSIDLLRQYVFKCMKKLFENNKC